MVIDQVGFNVSDFPSAKAFFDSRAVRPENFVLEARDPGLSLSQHRWETALIFRYRVYRLLVAALLLTCLPVWAEPTTAPVRAEIDALLARLQASGCEFNRNGKWYDGADAQAHLLRKLEYIEDRTTVRSTEQFIDLAASTSSRSGKPYLVRCAGGAPVESRAWLREQLELLRGKP